MALSEKTRATMYNYFSATPLGEEVTSEMIASFPDIKLDDLVTKDFLRAELAELSGGLRNEMAEQAQKSMRWTIATMITLTGVMSGLFLAVH